MTAETKWNLNDETIGKLQDLLQVNIDSRDGFEAAAEKTDEIAVAEKFRELARQRGEQVEELRSLVSANLEDPKDSGSFAAAAHRTWMDVRATLGGGTKAVLSEAEKGEDKIKQMYEEVLQDNPGTAVSDILHRHHAAIKAAHDAVREMRDSYDQG